MSTFLDQARERAGQSQQQQQEEQVSSEERKQFEELYDSDEFKDYMTRRGLK